MYKSYALITCMAVSIATCSHAQMSTEKFSNDKVRVLEETLDPGQSESAAATLPSVIVYMTAGKVGSGPNQAVEVHEGQTVAQPAGGNPLRNDGKSELHFARILFLTRGNSETWGMTGLSPNYKLLLDDSYARAYDIQIPAQTREPQHTHHDRVVVALSGAQLEHILPDGKIQPSTLKTGEIVWRLGGTHIGHNIGHTDLWCIAVEPK